MSCSGDPYLANVSLSLEIVQVHVVDDITILLITLSVHQLLSE